MKLINIKHTKSVVRVVRAHSIELHIHYRKIYELFNTCNEPSHIFNLLYELEAEFYSN